MATQTPITDAPIPSHIPADRVVDYDLYQGQIYSETGDLHEGLFRIAEDHGRGVFWTPHNGGHWFINDCDLLRNAARRTDLFSSTAMTIPPVPEEPKLIPLFLDPPDHGLFRAPLLKEFTPSRVLAMESDIRAFAIELIEEVREQGKCDFVDAIAEPLPIIIFMRIMGMPLGRLHEFRCWIYDMLSSDDTRRLSAYTNIAGLMGELIRERQAAPRDDLISRLLTVTIDGRPVTYDEMQAYCLLLFAAGLDTVANALAFGMNYVSRDPALQVRLHEDPGLVSKAVEEILRRFGVPMPARTATRDVEFGGAHIRKGERVMLMIPAANLDPKVFPDPWRFDPDRKNKTHVGFNVGPHRCIGLNLARLELNIFWEEWTRRIPHFRPDPDGKVECRAGLTLAIQKLPLIVGA